MTEEKKLRGRKPGVPNKTTVAVKQALTMAFEGLGGVPALIAWAKDAKNPHQRGEFYKLWCKLLPQEVTGKDGGPVSIAVVTAVPASPESPDAGSPG